MHQSAYNKLLLAYYHRTTRKKYADARADYEGMALVFHAVILILSSLRKNEITILLCFALLLLLLLRKSDKDTRHISADCSVKDIDVGVVVV